MSNPTCRVRQVKRESVGRLFSEAPSGQVAQVIGCDGSIDKNTTVDGQQITVARWSGPGSSSFSATLVTFRNDRMIAFGVNGQ